MAAENQSWQADIVNTVNMSTEQSPIDELPNNTQTAEETVNKDFQSFVNTVFSSKLRHENKLLDEDIHVHKGVNLTEVLSRLEAIIPNHTARIPSVDTYNHISIISQNLESYLQLLNEQQIETAANKISADTSKWISTLFGLDNTSSIFHKRKLNGLLKVCRLALHSKYSKYATDGFTALYTRPPVVYISAAAPSEFGKQLRNELGLPQSSICTVPCNTMFGSPFAMDVAAFERLLTDDVSCGKTPLILIAYAGTPNSGHTDNLGRLREICTQSGVWLHVEGDSLANLTLSHVQPSVQAAANADSLTFNLSKWFGMSTLPYCTFYRTNNAAMAVSAGLVADNIDKLVALPLWMIIQFMGTHDLKKIIEHACELSQQMCNRLDMINGIKRLEQPTGVSPVVIFKYKASPSLPLSQNYNQDDVTRPKKPVTALPRGKIDISPKLAESFNQLIISHLEKSSPKVAIEAVNISREGTCLKFNPIQTSRSQCTSKTDVDEFVEQLQLMIVQMDFTLINRSSFQEIFQRIPDVVLIDVSEQPAIGAFQCIPKYWKTKTMSNLSDLKKHEANELNKNILSGLSHHFNCLEERALPNGQSCIQMGIVDDTFNLQQFAEAVLKCTIDMEDNVKFVESIQDSVQQSIAEAQERLTQDRDERFFKDGVLRSVPVVSSLYNWWSPPPKDSHGVTGRSFDLSSGKLESTEQIYKHKMQVQDDDQLDRLSQISHTSNRSSVKEEKVDTTEQQSHDGSYIENKEDENVEEDDEVDEDDLSEIDSNDDAQDSNELVNEQDTSELVEEGEDVKESDV